MLLLLLLVDCLFRVMHFMIVIALPTPLTVSKCWLGVVHQHRHIQALHIVEHGIGDLAQKKGTERRLALASYIKCHRGDDGKVLHQERGYY